MRVGIVTINVYTNYGNRLQNYALTKLLNEHNIEVVNGLAVCTKEEWVNNTQNKLKKVLKRFTPFFYVKNKYFQEQEIREELKQREKNFRLFVDSYTNMVSPIMTRTIKEAKKEIEKLGIDYFVVGSDQVWSPDMGIRDCRFLTFTEESKRFSFAASIGMDYIPDEWIPYFKKNLNKMKYISVREEKAAQIVKELTGREADVTLDPTLLLSKEEWEKVVKKPSIHLEEEYICTYFLGEVPEAVYKFAQEKNLPIYQLNCKEEKELYNLGPAEFLYLIKNAKYVMTDSFHGTAFSIKFKKEFYVFKRKHKKSSSMFSRIETITTRFHLEDRIQDRELIIETTPITKWQEIEEELNHEKTNSVNKLIKLMV